MFHCVFQQLRLNNFTLAVMTKNVASYGKVIKIGYAVYANAKLLRSYTK